jgi:hypothetical protein
MADACTDCPEYIRSAVRRPVQDALDQVRSVKNITQFLNAAIAGKVGNAAASVAAVIATIPLPPVLDVSEIVSTITCPLTPVALALDPTLLAALDPRVVVQPLQNTFAQFVRDLMRSYDDALEALAEASVVSIIRRVFDDIKNINFDAANLAKAIAITAYVETTCPEEYADGPYQDLDAELTDFTLDKGFVPVDQLEDDVRDVMLELGEGELKIAAWREAATFSAVF